MLEAKSIDLKYGAAQALRAVGLVAEPGKVTCVLGRNGVGKTSLLDALAGQHPISRGSILWEGRDITTLSATERARRGIAYVPQGREIFPLLTVKENLETGFAPLARRDRHIPDDVFSLFPVLETMLGRNGVGKSSLLRAIVGHHPVSAGRILYDGADITRMPAYERARRGIAYVPQGREIFPLLTVRENLETGFARLPRERRRIPAEVFELFPVLGSMLGRRGGDLSGGQQQQLAIARALVMEPQLMVLDEPTEGIQPSIIKDIGRAIGYLREKGRMAILLVEQYFDFARELADTYAVLERGEVVLSGEGAAMVESDVRRYLTV